MRKYIVTVIVMIVSAAFSPRSWCETSLQERFRGKDTLTYAVSFNGMNAGKIVWKYHGQKTVEGKIVDVLEVRSDTQIGRILRLESDEIVYLDAVTHLPVKVERDITLFGKRERIEELYHQERGQVVIRRFAARGKEETYNQKKPIHNILALLYFFPVSADLAPGESYVFNLPTNQVTIKFNSFRKDPNFKKDSYFLVGRGARRFNLWLDKQEKIPLRLEFISLAGKIVIVRENVS